VVIEAGQHLLHYRLIEKIGEGGMGVVWKAEDTKLHRPVALKFLASELQNDAVAFARLRREAKSAAALDHPYICKVYDIGEMQDGRPFIAMEFVDGETLASRLERKRPSHAEALRIAVEVAEALEKAHEEKIVHRDLKPANVMIGRDRHVKVTDFGLAIGLRDESPQDQTVTLKGLTQAGQVAGTPGYMSPEQLRGAAIDGRSDLFAFGVVVHELLTGTHPFRRTSVPETMAAIFNEAPSGREHLPAAIRPLVDGLLAKDAKARPSPEETRFELQRLTERPELLQVVASPRRPFVGRESELAELRVHAERARSGTGNLVLVGGEPGVGKTRLTEEILSEAREHGFLVLEGHSYEQEGGQPYLPWVESLDLALRALPADRLREALGADAAEVAKLAPQLHNAYEDIPEPIELPPEQQQRFLFNSFRAFVERLSGHAPIVWLLDDLHWTDNSSLALFQHLAQHLDELPVLILGTYRDVELDVRKPFEKTMSQLVRQRQVERITLKRLSEETVASLLSALGGGPAPEAFVHAVYRETEGNPFFVEEVFEHLSEEGKLFDEQGRWLSELRLDELEVPEGVRLVIGRRLERLSEGTPKLLTAAAVLGRVFELRVLEELQGFDADDVLDAIEEAEAARLIGAASAGRVASYSFSHELIRHTLLDGLSLPRRQRLHFRIANALEKVQPERVADIAQHYYQAGAAVDPHKAIEYLKLAGEQALAAAAAEDALRHFETALSFEELEDGRTKAELLLHRAEAYWGAGQGEKSYAGWKEALPHFEALQDRERVAHVHISLAECSLLLGRMAEQAAIGRRAMDALSDDRSPSQCLLLAAIGLARAHDGGTDDDGEAALAEAVALAESLGDTHLLGRVLFYQAFFYLSCDRPAALLESAARGAELLRGHDEPWYLADVLKWKALGHVFTGDIRAVRALRKELEPLARRVGNVWALMEIVRASTTCELMETGDLDAWEVGWREDIALNEQHDSKWTEHSHLGLGRAEFWRGNWNAALERLSHAVTLENPGKYSGPCSAGLFLTKSYAGHDDTLAFLRRSFGDLDGLSSDRNAGNCWALPLVVEGLAVLGERALLVKLHPRIRETARSEWVLSFAGFQQFKKAAAIAAAAIGEYEEAEAFFFDAFDEAERLPIKLEQPEVRRWFAKMLIERDAPGDRARARTLLEEAIDGYRAIGMPRHLEMAERLVATAGN
jgi:tRNA A-37 threonylcarbamoyl transferase component Bud32/tetratricopeptide (TPR) repeat protein